MRLPQNQLAEVAEGDNSWSPRAHSVSAIPEPTRHRVGAFTLFALVLGGCFSQSLYALLRFAVHNDLYSHIILLPFISGYLIWLKRQNLPCNAAPSRKFAAALFVIGGGFLAARYSAAHSGSVLGEEGALALMTLGFLTFLWGGWFFFFGATTVLAVIFPLSLLLFAVPLPESVLYRLETFLQIASAAVAHLFFQVSGTPVLRQGTFFQLPGFSLQVALECSGIHSSLVLFITSLIAAHLLLRKFWTKALLVAFVIPLAIIRNGIRVFTIAQLCIQISPEMAHSYIHKHGGPIFFAASLIPFFVFVLLLRKIEARSSKFAVSPGSGKGCS